MYLSQVRFFVARWRSAGPSLALALLLLIVSLSVVACSGLSFGGGGSTPTATPSHLALAKLRWCGKPLVLFRDEGVLPSPTVTATTAATATATGTATGTVTATSTAAASSGKPKTITDWSQVQPQLGFTVYLPTTFPTHTCLVSVSGTIHDPIFGGSFIIGYLLPNHSSISLSEAPLRTQNPAFQCSPSSSLGGTPTATSTPKTGVTPTPTAIPTQLCSGAKGTTNIFFSSSGTTAQLQQFFNGLQPNVDWMPAS